MNTEELTMLLTRIQVIEPHRPIDQLTIEAWEPILDGIGYGDAVGAVNEHYRTTTAYLTPAHIVDGARRIREARAQQVTFDPLNRACVRGLLHHWDPTSGWCHNGCGWRDDGQSEYNPHQVQRPYTPDHLKDPGPRAYKDDTAA